MNASGSALSKVLLGSAVLAALMFGFAGCRTDEDENDMINLESSDSASCNFTNDTDYDYSRGFITTKTNHLAADMLVTISGKDSSDKGVTAGYIFNLTGDGSDSSPYNFALLGLRYNSGNPQYFLSYYTGVRGKKGSVNDITSDKPDFDNDETTNKAIEWAVDGVDGWTSIGSNASTVSNGSAVIYVKMTPMGKLDNDLEEKPVTTANYGTYKDNLTSIKIELYKADTDGNATGDALVSKKFSASTLTKSSSDPSSSRTYSGTISEDVKIDQNPLGYYAMVGKGNTLNCTWKLGGGTGTNIVKSVVTGDEEVFIWNEEIDNIN